MMVHDNTALPQIDHAGLYLSSGKRHRISYKKKANYLLESPYSDCTNTIAPTMEALFNKYADADYQYSQPLCNILCIQAYTYEILKMKKRFSKWLF